MTKDINQINNAWLTQLPFIYRSFFMAKTNESKNEVRKLQKEIAVLKNKLKAAEKKTKDVHNNWTKKHQGLQKDVAKRVEVAHKAGHAQATAESAKIAAARKKVIQTAEASFEKGFKKKPTSAKPVRKSSAKTAKAKKQTKSRVATKKVKAAKVTKLSRAKSKVTKAQKPKTVKKQAASSTKKVKTTSVSTRAKRRSRPANAKQEHRPQETHHLNAVSEPTIIEMTDTLI